MLFPLILLSAVAAALTQNAICPMCSLGPPGFGQSPLNQGFPSLPSIVETAPTFSSYSRNNNPLSMYQGNPAMFGTELGRAIAQRIQQLYAQGGANGGGGLASSGSSNYASYPDALPERPQSAPSAYGTDYVQAQADTRTAEYPAPSAPSRGGCPYCFGNGNNNYGSNLGYGGNSGSYAASPNRGRRVEFVKRQKQT